MLRRSLTPFRIGLFVLAFALCAPATFGQMPQPDTSDLLSSSDVSDEDLQRVARILVTAQMSTQKQRMKMRKDAIKMKKKMAQMDSTQKAQVRRKFQKRQMAMQRKQMKVIQKQAKEEGMQPQMVQRIMRSSQRDSTLQNRIREAMKTEAKKRSSMQGGGPQGGQGSSPQNQ